MHAPAPGPLALSCPEACSTSTQTPSPQGLVLLAWRQMVLDFIKTHSFIWLLQPYFLALLFLFWG